MTEFMTIWARLCSGRGSKTCKGLRSGGLRSLIRISGLVRIRHNEDGKGKSGHGLESWCVRPSARTLQVTSYPAGK